jgi:hypothetical protein
VLLGLLLLVSTAAETTDIWFALPMAGFVVAALSAQVRTTMIEHQPAGEAPPPGMRLAPLALVAAGSLALGTVIFFAIPRIGAGWGRQLANQKQQSEPRWRPGSRTRSAWGPSARSRCAGASRSRRRSRRGSDHLDSDSIYWRARPFSLWTGQGWAEDKSDRLTILTLPVARPVLLPGETTSADPGLIADIEMRLERAPAVIAPGRPVWIKTPRETELIASADGALTHPEGRIPKRYTVAVRSPRLPFVEPPPGSSRVPDAGENLNLPAGQSAEPISSRSLAREYPGEGEDARGAPSGTSLDFGEQPEEVRAWARRVGADQVDPLRIARAFVADLSRRPYSLDTRAVDPRRPIASFLAGAPAHCEYFASAMVLGLRERGIPARVVGGFLGADRSSFGASTSCANRGRTCGWRRTSPARVDDVRSHSRGGTGNPLGVAERAPGRLGERPSGPGTPSSSGSTSAARRICSCGRASSCRAPTGFVARNALLVATTLGVAAFFVWTFVARRRRRRSFTPLDTAGIPHAYRRFLAHAASRGLLPAAGETAREFARRAGSTLGDPRDVALVSHSYERERFRRREAERAGSRRRERGPSAAPA